MCVRYNEALRYIWRGELIKMLVRSWRNPFSSWQIRLVNSSVAFYCDCDFSFRRPFIPTNLFVIFFFGRIPQKKRIGFWGLVKRNHFWLWWIRNNSRVFAWVFNGMRQIAILVLVCFFFYCCCWETKMKFNSRWQIKWYFCTNYIFFNFGFEQKKMFHDRNYKMNVIFSRKKWTNNWCE